MTIPTRSRLEAFADLTQIHLTYYKREDVVIGAHIGYVELGPLMLGFSFTVQDAQALSEDLYHDAAMVLAGPSPNFILVMAYDGAADTYLAYIVDATQLNDPSPKQVLSGVDGVVALEEKLAPALKALFAIPNGENEWERLTR